jgi:hypothetical protein
MNSKEILPVLVVSGLLAVNCFLIFYNPDTAIINIISLAGPFLIIWMVYSVLKFGQYKGPQLKEEEEWGYADKKRDDMGIF